MLLVAAMDEGPIIGLGIQDLDDSFTTPSLTEQLIQLSYALLRDQLPAYIEKGQMGGVPQSDLPTLITDFAYPSEPSYSRKLTKEDGVLDFQKSATQLQREVRAFIEWPKTRTVIAGKDVVITSAHVETKEVVRPAGEVFIDAKQLCIETSQGTLVIDRLKPAGKAEMTAEAFLAGHGRDLKK